MADSDSLSFPIPSSPLSLPLFHDLNHVPCISILLQFHIAPTDARSKFTSQSQVKLVDIQEVLQTFDEPLPMQHFVCKFHQLLQPSDQNNTFECKLFGSILEVLNFLWHFQEIFLCIESASQNDQEISQSYITFKFNEVISFEEVMDSHTYDVERQMDHEQENMKLFIRLKLESFKYTINQLDAFENTSLITSLVRPFYLFLNLIDNLSSRTLLSRPPSPSIGNNSDGNTPSLSAEIICGHIKGITHTNSSACRFTMVLVDRWDEVEAYIGGLSFFTKIHGSMLELKTKSLLKKVYQNLKSPHDRKIYGISSLIHSSSYLNKPRRLTFEARVVGVNEREEPLETLPRPPFSSDVSFIKPSRDSSFQNVSSLQPSSQTTPRYSHRGDSASNSSDAARCFNDTAPCNLLLQASQHSHHSSSAVATPAAIHHSISPTPSSPLKSARTDSTCSGPPLLYENSWNLEIECVAIRLPNCFKGVCVGYSYPLFGLNRMYFTHPPIDCETDTWAKLSNGFCAFTLKNSFEQLKKVLEDNFIPIHVWCMQGSSQDEEIGECFIHPANILNQPLQYLSSKLETQIRFLDSVYPIYLSDNQIGSLRLQIMLACQNQNNERPLLKRMNSSSNLPQGSTMNESLPASIELDLWKRVEKLQFESSLKKKEMELLSELESQHAVLENSRQKEFDKKRDDLHSIKLELVEKTHHLQRKMMELQQMETTLVHELKRISSDEKRAKEEYAATLQRITMEHDATLLKESERYSELLERKRVLETERDLHQKRAIDLEKEVFSLSSQLADAPSTQIRLELGMKTFEVQDLKSKLKAMTSSRDHFLHSCTTLLERLNTIKLSASHVPRFSDKETFEMAASIQKSVSDMQTCQPPVYEQDEFEHHAAASRSHSVPPRQSSTPSFNGICNKNQTSTNFTSPQLAHSQRCSKPYSPPTDVSTHDNRAQPPSDVTRFSTHQSREHYQNLEKKISLLLSSGAYKESDRVISTLREKQRYIS